jgi:hypothetical protein
MITLPFETVLDLPLDATLTYRLARVELVRLQTEAKSLGLSTGAYVRMLTVDEATRHKLSVILERRNRRAEFATILMALGKSRIASNINQIAYSMNTGTLNFTPDVIGQINEAYEAIMYIRSLLMKETGVRS